jgi:hypothetical protein
MGARAGAMTADNPPPVSSGGGDGSPESIAAEIEATREELGAILAALERRLAPQQLLERGLDMLKETMDGSDGGLGETLRRHPLPLVLIGMGVGWIAFAASTRGQPGEAVRETARRYPTDLAGYAHAREKAGEAMDRAQQAVSDAAGRARHGAETAWRQASAIAEQAADRVTRPRRRVGELMADYPLAFGALGLLAGAAAAFLLPRSAAEERWAGSAGAELRHRAADVGGEAVARARHVTERTLDAAQEAAGEAVEKVDHGLKGGEAENT